MDRFVQAMDQYAEGIINKEELLHLVRNAVGNLELIEKVKKIISHNSIEIVRLLEENLLDYQWALIPQGEQHVDLYTRASPSYQFLSCKFNVKGSVCNSYSRVLNSFLVSHQIMSSEDSNFFKHSKKSQCEETLFFSEDEQSEMDLVLEVSLSTAHVIKELDLLHAELASTGKSERYFMENSIFYRMHLSALMRVYNSHIQEIVECIKCHPATVYPLILRRLQHEGDYWYFLRGKEKKKHHDNLLQLYNQGDIGFAGLVYNQTSDQVHHLLSSSVYQIDADKTPVLHKQINEYSMHQTVLNLLICANERSAQRARMVSFTNFFKEVVLSFYGSEADNTILTISAFHSSSSSMNSSFKLCHSNNTEPLVVTREAYVFFRMYHLLLERLQLARKLSEESQFIMPSAASMKKDAFELLILSICGLLDGSINRASFEAFFVRLLGTSGNVLLDIDKFIVQTTKCLQVWMQQKSD